MQALDLCMGFDGWGANAHLVHRFGRGGQNWARENTAATTRTNMCSGHTVTDNCITAIFVMATPFRHCDLNIVRNFSCP